MDEERADENVPVGCIGAGLIVWVLLGYEAYRLPGARWLGTHAPLWVVSLSLGLAIWGLGTLVLLASMQTAKADSWIGIVALCAFLSQTALLSIWLRYSPLKVPWFVGAIVVAGVLLLAISNLARRKYRGRQ